MGLLVPVLQVAGDRQAAAACDVDCRRVVSARLPSIGKGPCRRGRETVTEAYAGAYISIESGSGWVGRDARIVKALGRGEAGEVEVITLVPVDLEVVWIVCGIAVELEAVSHPDTRRGENTATASHAPCAYKARVSNDNIVKAVQMIVHWITVKERQCGRAPERSKGMGKLLPVQGGRIGSGVRIGEGLYAINEDIDSAGSVVSDVI